MERPGIAYHRVRPKPFATQKDLKPALKSPSPLAAADSWDDGDAALLRHRVNVQSPPKQWRSSISKRSCGRVLNDSWTWELVGIFVCLSALASICGILLAYDQGPLPHSVAGISLNTAISILATISRATTISIAASIIAQQKWVRLVRTFQPLSSVEMYDDATRGPLGSLFLLLSGPKSISAIAVALVTVLAIGFEPFVQQSLNFPPKESLVARNIPVLSRTTNISYGESDVTANKSILFDALLLQALYAERVAPLQPACSANTCNWPIYTSAALCSSCIDALDQTTVSSNDSNALTALATGNYLDDFQGTDDLSSYDYLYSYTVQTNYSVSLGTGPSFPMTMNFTGFADTGGVTTRLDYPQDIVWSVATRPALEPGHGIPWYPNMTGPLTRLGYVRLDRSDDGFNLEATSASICTISLCAQEQISSSINGTFSQNVTGQVWGNYTSALFFGGTGYEWAAQTSSVNVSTIDAELVNRLDALITSLEDTSTQSLVVSYHGYNLNSSGSFYDYGATTLNPAPNTLQFISDTANSSAKIAQTFTNYFDQGGNTQITGEAYEVVPFVNVRWAWLSYPIIVVLMCSVTLFVTIYQSRKMGLPTWKTSPFPLLFGYQHRDQVVGLTSMSSSVGHGHGTDEGESDGELSRTQRQAIIPGKLPVEQSTSQYSDLANKELVRLTKYDRRWIFEGAS